MLRARETSPSPRSSVFPEPLITLSLVDVLAASYPAGMWNAPFASSLMPRFLVLLTTFLPALACDGCPASSGGLDADTSVPTIATSRTGEELSERRVELTLTLDAILRGDETITTLDDGRFRASDKPDGSASYIVTPLLEALGDTGADPSTPAPSRPEALTIVADGLTRHRTLEEVMVTAGRAGFDDVELAVTASSGARRAIRLCAPRSLPQIECWGGQWPESSFERLQRVLTGQARGHRLDEVPMVFVREDGLFMGCARSPVLGVQESLREEDLAALPESWESSCEDPRQARRAERRLGPPACAYPLDALSTWITNRPRAQLDDGVLVLAIEAGVTLDVLVSIADAARFPRGEGSEHPLTRVVFLNGAPAMCHHEALPDPEVAPGGAVVGSDAG